MESKSELMACLNSNDIQQFEVLLSRIVSKTDEFNYIEVSELMSLAEHESFCFKLSSYVDYFIKQLHQLQQQQSSSTSTTAEADKNEINDENMNNKISNSSKNDNDTTGTAINKTTTAPPPPPVAISALLNEEKAVKCLLKASEVIFLYTHANLLKYRPPSLLLAIQFLHNLLILLDDKIIGVINLKNSISKICEYWWIHQLHNAEQYITQLIPYLLLAALRVGAHETDIKRLYKVQTALLLLDFDDDSIESIRNMLLRCTAHPLFLKSKEGNKFLSFVFTIHLGLPPLILDVMRAQLMDPHSSSSSTGSVKLAAVFGRILYHAWKKYAHLTDNANSTSNNNNNSSNNTNNTNNETHQQQHQQLLSERESIQECLQTLVHEAIHTTDAKYFRSLRVLLSAFHDAKRYKGVDTMLLKVYGPILWRSLKCANAVVRVQATMIFFDSFPLQDEHASAMEADSILQRQFDLFSSMLKDTDHRVRAAAASGVCHVLQEFWSALPYATTKQTLAYIVGTLGRDAACANVRIAVMTGLLSLLDQPLAHSVLKNLLPILSTAIHDHSERVRIAFINILIKVKLIRGITFYNIAAVDHLLLRLEDDYKRPQVCMRMTELLLNSFFPFDVPRLQALSATGNNNNEEEDEEDEETVAVRVDKERCRRCVEFLHKSPYAAMAFYTHLHTQVSLIHLTRFAMSLFQLFIAMERQQGNNNSNNNNNRDVEHDDDDDDDAINKGKHKNKNTKPSTQHKQQQAEKKQHNKRKASSTANNNNNTASSNSSSLAMLLLLESSETYIHILRVIHVLLSSLQKQQPQQYKKSSATSMKDNSDSSSNEVKEIKKALLLIFSRQSLNQTLTTIHSLTNSSNSSSAAAAAYPQLISYVADINNYLLEIHTIIQTYAGAAAVSTSTKNSSNREEDNNIDNDYNSNDNRFLSTQHFIRDFDKQVIVAANNNNNNNNSSEQQQVVMMETQARVVVKTAVALGDKEKLYNIIMSTFNHHHIALVNVTTTTSATTTVVTNTNNNKTTKKRKNENTLLHPTSTVTTTFSSSIVSLATAVELLSACCLTLSPTEQFIESLSLLQATFHAAITLVTDWLSLKHQPQQQHKESINGECTLPVMAQLVRLWLVTVMQLHQLGITTTTTSTTTTTNNNVLSVEYMTEWVSTHIIDTICPDDSSHREQHISNCSAEENYNDVEITINIEAATECSMLCNILLNVYSDVIQLVSLSTSAVSVATSLPTSKDGNKDDVDNLLRMQHDVWLSPLLQWINQLGTLTTTSTTASSSVTSTTIVDTVQGEIAGSQQQQHQLSSLLSVGLCRLLYVLVSSFLQQQQHTMSNNTTAGAMHSLLTRFEYAAVTTSLINLLLVPMAVVRPLLNNNNDVDDDDDDEIYASPTTTATATTTALIVKTLSYILLHVDSINNDNSSSDSNHHHRQRHKNTTGGEVVSLLEQRIVTCLCADYSASGIVNVKKSNNEQGDAEVNNDDDSYNDSISTFLSSKNVHSGAARLVCTLLTTSHHTSTTVATRGSQSSSPSHVAATTAEIGARRLLSIVEHLSQKLCETIATIAVAGGAAQGMSAVIDSEEVNGGEEECLNSSTVNDCVCMATLLHHIIFTVVTASTATVEDNNNNNSSNNHNSVLLRQVLDKTKQHISPSLSLPSSSTLTVDDGKLQQSQQAKQRLVQKLLTILSSSLSTSS